MINYFNFKKFGSDYLITNDFGHYAFVPENELLNLIVNKKVSDISLKKELEQRYFLFDSSEQEFSSIAKFSLRNGKNYLFQSTALHIFVVSMSCNLKCKYCQAQNGVKEPFGMMNKETAEKAVALAFSSPNKNLSFEFQGGEPLTNFEIIKYIVELSEKNKVDRCVTYSLVSNLILLTDEITDFIKKYNISVSTSLDGNKYVHDSNRPARNGSGSFDIVTERIKSLKQQGINVGAIQTTTRYSINYAREIVDTYCDLGFNEIFLRPLTPLGTAKKDWENVGYSEDEFLAFYRNSLDIIIEKNKNGINISEQYASIMLRKILCNEAVNYMELRSPCGASLGQMAYFYDGNIFTCDEGRMLYEMGDDSFNIGNVNTSSYDDLMNSNVTKTVCKSSIIESLPECCDCVYQPYCGVCPVVNYAMYNDIYPKEFEGYKCKINKGILDYLFTLIRDDKEAARILRCWI